MIKYFGNIYKGNLNKANKMFYDNTIISSNFETYK